MCLYNVHSIYFRKNIVKGITIILILHRTWEELKMELKDNNDYIGGEKRK